MRLEATEVPSLPRLAWLAVLRPGEFVRAFHGRGVEVSESFLVEGVWGGAFEAGLFSSSETFFGSGLHLSDDGTVTIVPSRGLVDRLLIARHDSTYVVANSLPLILFALRAQLDPREMYLRETYAIQKGLRRYEPVIPLKGPSELRLEQRYHFPVLISASGLRVLDSRFDRTFSSYDDYHSFLVEEVLLLCTNARSSSRKHPLNIYSTLSRGYDSPATTAILSEVASPRAFTVPRSNSWVPQWLHSAATSDDGRAIAGHLGVEIHAIEAAGPLHIDERVFFAAGGSEPELVFRALADSIAADDVPAALFTGYHGGGVWSLDKPPCPRDEILRSDVSGLALSEARLSGGWINVPLPFIGAKATPSLHQIARGEDMSHWRVGGAYDRPIPRRIVEDRGVPRALFGERKRAVVQAVILPRRQELRQDFARWLKQNNGLSLPAYRLLATASLMRWGFLRFLQKGLALLGWRLDEPRRWQWLPVGDPNSLLFKWSIASLSSDAEIYPSLIREAVEADMRNSSSASDRP